MIKTVFLDLDDTILDFQLAEHKAIRSALAEVGVEPTDEVVARYIEINRSCWAALERGELTREVVLTRRFELLFDELSLDISPTETQKIYAERLGSFHDFLPGGKELLDELYASGKYNLYLATNGIYKVQAPRIEASGISKYFKDIFISEKLGYNKPSREFFERCAEKIEGYNPKEAIIVGDSLSSDIQGGINAGILTCHFNPKSTPYTSIKPDYKINKLSELLPLLESIE